MNGKKLSLILLLLAAVLLCTACSEGSSGGGKASASDTVPVILNQAEYLLYQNIYENGYASQYVGKETTKVGIFAVLRDAFSDMDRYYVWGYLDNTKCCDWQWEIKPTNTKNLPSPGSVVMVSGAFTASQDALDGYWITDPILETQTRYTGDIAEVDMLTMSNTLERVQMANIVRMPDAFEGKKFSAYGRIQSAETLQDPYYDGSWYVPFTFSADLPAIGTTVSLRGTIQSGSLAGASLTKLD